MMPVPIGPVADVHWQGPSPQEMLGGGVQEQVSSEPPEQSHHPFPHMAVQRP
jgi:hypothetical protein